MKKIFVYYSETGNGDYIAKFFKDKKYDIEKIESKKLPKTMFFQMMVGGFKALVGYKDKINSLKHNLDDYDEIIIGSPIWFDRLCSPIRTFLNKYKIKVNKFILYSGSGEGIKAKEYIKANYPGSDIIILKQPKSNKKELDKLDI